MPIDNPVYTIVINLKVTNYEWGMKALLKDRHNCPAGLIIELVITASADHSSSLAVPLTLLSPYATE